MFCPKCGANAGNSNFCPKCGYNLGDVPVDLMHSQQMAQQQPVRTPRSASVPPKKKKHHIGRIVLIIILVVVLTPIIVTTGVILTTAAHPTATTSTVSSASSMPRAKVKQLVAADEFANAGLDKLQKAFGSGVKDKHGIGVQDANGQVSTADIYDFALKDGGAWEAIIFNGKTIRLTYTAPPSKDISYTDERSILEMFGIVLGKNLSPDIVISANTGASLRYKNVTKKVCDFWVQIMDGTAKTFNTVKITYTDNIVIGVSTK